MSSIFQISHVTKSFHRDGAVTNALDDVSLDVPDGSFFGIVGTSGAGKSTLLRMLNLLETPSSGTITFDGKDLAQFSGKRRGEYLSEVATIFQHFNLFHSKTVLQNIAFPLAIRGVSRSERNRRARELIELVGLNGKERAYPSQLSGGQKQRVGIARALISKPRVLLCDEATSALDSETTRVILTLLKDLQKALGFTTILITHSWEVVRYACDRATLIRHGKIIESGAVLDLVAQPDSILGALLLPAPEGDPAPSDQAHFDLIFQEPGDQTEVLSDIAREFELRFSILSGRVEKVAEKTVARFKVVFTAPEGAPEGTPVNAAALRARLLSRGIVIGESTPQGASA
ncbi:methionine ABC transporter ATP-binding protein [Humidisolicoccus flavus]|uniref:methionine ABC transporter ATP-binding protein n=1 Tax=Humidisolicoccus flavus TaxID=3111414 RepID=UPI0032511605